MPSLYKIIALGLAIALTKPAQASPRATQMPQEDPQRVKRLKAQIDSISIAQSVCNENPARGAEYLSRSLEALGNFAPEISAKRELQSIQRRANLALARAYHNSQQSQRAHNTLRRLYRSDAPPSSELKRLGPSMVALGEDVATQVASLKRGQLSVQCARPCQAYLDERNVDLESSHLEGKYRLYVQDLAGQTPPLRRELQLHAGGPAIQVRYDNEAPAAAASVPPRLKLVNPTTPNDPPTNPSRSTHPYPKPVRIAPLWLELTGVSTGIAAMGAGTVLWLMDGEPQPASQQSAEPQVYNTKLAGKIFLGAGAATALVFGILLVIDQKNVNQKSPAKLGNRRWRHPLQLRF